MWLKQVTITGVDQFVDYNKLALLSLQYPFVEWGFSFFRTDYYNGDENNESVNAGVIENFHTSMLTHQVYPLISLRLDAAQTKAFIKSWKWREAQDWFG